MEDKLQDVREQINDIDAQLAALFVKRMEAVKQVAEIKMANNLEVFDEKREKQVIEKGKSLIDKEELKDLYGEFLQNAMEVSKKYQRRIIEEKQHR